MINLKEATFMGYRRENGRMGIRNHVVILPLDDLSNAACEAVANNIKEHLEVPISVHFDYNSNKDFISNQLYEAAIGYAKSYGFDAMGKPFAPAASYAADKQCRL